MEDMEKLSGHTGKALLAINKHDYRAGAFREKAALFAGEVLAAAAGSSGNIQGE